MRLELGGSHIRKGIVFIGGGIAHARCCRLCVKFGDLIVVVVVDLGAHVQLTSGDVVLVLLGHELQELWVVEHLVEGLRVLSGSEASKRSEGEI